MAFLNKSGGDIYLGIDDNENVIGINDIDGTQCEIKDRLKHNIEPSIMGLFDVNVVQRDGKKIIKVTVAKSANVKKNKTVKYSVKLAKVTKKVKTNKIKVTVKNKKIAKVTVKKTAKGQITYSVKGLKKGKTTATIKYGKKSVKVNVVVK